MNARMTVLEAKDYWFGEDLTVCAMDGEGDFWGALPRREVIRGHRYLKKLENCKTIEQAQVVYEQYISDPEAPKLLPRRLINFLDEAEQILEFLESAIEEKLSGYESLVFEHLEQGSDLDLYNCIKNQPFDLYESNFYRDESDMNVIYGQPSLVTDTWIPIEIAQKVGVRDEGEGFFYETVEYVYPDFVEFSLAFRDLGFEVLPSSNEIEELTGQKGTAPTQNF